MKRNFLIISLFLIGIFTCFSCEANTLQKNSSEDSDGVCESMPTAQQWNKDIVDGILATNLSVLLLDRMASRCRLATLMVPSMQRQLGAIPLLPRR